MESHSAPRFTHAIFFITPPLSVLSLSLSVSHTVNLSPAASIYLSESVSLIRSLLLCRCVFSQASERSPLRSSQPFGDCALGLTDVASPPSNTNHHPHHHPPLPCSLPTPPPQTKPSSGSLSLIALPPLCARHSSQQSMPDSLGRHCVLKKPVDKKTHHLLFPCFNSVQCAS